MARSLEREEEGEEHALWRSVVWPPPLLGEVGLVLDFWCSVGEW